jgi:diguanylate cyclase (GGDEF)-like protein/PAS domain S-box-containing protein
MPLTVRRKLQLLLFGSLTAALLLVAVALTWQIGRQHELLAERNAHAMLRDIADRIADMRRKLAASATALADREESVASLALLTDYATPENYQPLIYDEEKKKLAYSLHLQAEQGLPTELAAYDGHGRIVAFDMRATPSATTHRYGFSSWEEGAWRLYDAESGSEDWQPASLPASLSADVAAFGRPSGVVARLQRSGRQLLIETVVPVRRQRGEESRIVGWLRLATPLPVAELDAQAGLRNMAIGLLFSGDFDSRNVQGLQPADLVGVPALEGMAQEHRPEDVPPRARQFLDVAALALAGDEMAWITVALDRQFAQAEQRRALLVAFAVLAASLLLVLPLTGWLGRRWISDPLDRVRDGVHAYALGRLDTHIDYPVMDEFGTLAEDFNLLAVAVRVREIAISEAEERWRAMIDAIERSGIGLYIVDDQFRIRYSSRSADSLFGEALTGQICHQAIFGHAERCNFCPLQRVIGAGETVRLQPPPIDGRSYDILAMPVGEVGGRRKLLALIQDITERIETERRMREAATVFEATSEAIMVTDAQGIIKRINPAFTAVTGYSPEEAIGQTPRILKSGRHDQSHYEEMWSSLLTSGRWEGEVWNRRKSGEIFPEWQIISTVKDAQGHPVEYVSLFIDITQKKRTEAEIVYRANYDALTGLPNRNLMAERLGQALKKAHREELRVALMFVDLDLFKQVNDTLGHHIGDRLLQSVAERLRLCVRETDTVARQGGDEFVVLLPDVEDSAAAGVVADKIIAQLSAPVMIDAHEIHIGASIGITLYPDDGRDIEVLFRNADLAMYRAKDAGRNNAQFFEPTMTAAALERRAMEADLRGALARGEFALHYQPVIDLANGRIAGAEALLRWQHPRQGEIRPDRFIPLAEDTGLIREIGAWVFEEGCRQLAAWQAAGYGALTLAINVSVRQLPDSLAVDHILATLARHGLKAEQLVLEITESVLLAESPYMQQWFAAAGAAGLQLAIDDFGTGYSSLAYLKRYPVHHVKIDQSFVRDMAQDATDRALVEAILAMAHSLGLSVVAEGVETPEQAGLLTARACELAQGYLYSRPVPAEKFPELLARALSD